MVGTYDFQEYDDVEIVISRATDGKGYRVHIRLLDLEPVSKKLPQLPFQIQDEASDPLIYGEHLFQWLFQGEVAEEFSYARWLASEQTRGFKFGTRLRLRLSLDSQSSELRRLYWESLYTPDGKQPFSLTTAFSRFLRIKGPRSGPIRERPLRMLLVISTRKGIDPTALEEMDPSPEKSIIKDATRQLFPLLKLEKLEPPTLAHIQAAGKASYHIVHLLAPAVFHDDQGYLILSDDSGQAQEVPFEEVVRAIVPPSEKPPGLVFLAVPLTTRQQGDGTLIGLAQMLIEAGVSALVAIRSPIGASDLRRFIERFYDILIRTGVVDQAMASARTEIYRPESWEWTYPVLYMNMPDGRLFQPLPMDLESEINSSKIGREKE